jgi:hypothetical protein
MALVTRQVVAYGQRVARATGRRQRARTRRPYDCGRGRIVVAANPASRLHLALSRQRVRLWLERATGVVLISFGFRVAFRRR